MTKILIDGPYFEDFTVGQTFSAPSITLTTGHAAMYQAITGDRMRLPLDHQLSRRVTGNDAPFAHPHLVVNVVNGQTTYPSQHVKGNLFYRGLILRRPVFIGDTLTTSTKSIGLKQNRPKPGRPATGKEDKRPVGEVRRFAALLCDSMAGPQGRPGAMRQR